MDDVLHITQEGGLSTTAYLTTEQGAALKLLIQQNIDSGRLTSYCHQVGMQYTNVANMLNGKKKVSLKTLQRLLSNSPLEVECRVEFIITKKDTSIAQDADLRSLDDILFLEDMENAQKEQ